MSSLNLWIAANADYLASKIRGSPLINYRYVFHSPILLESSLRSGTLAFQRCDERQRTTFWNQQSYRLTVPQDGRISLWSSVVFELQDGFPLLSFGCLQTWLISPWQGWSCLTYDVAVSWGHSHRRIASQSHQLCSRTEQFAGRLCNL